MGFKQLKQFNLALLAKQGWRLQIGSKSLLFLVFKAKYFPNSDFVQATVGSKPSFARRSIMATQDIVRRGLRWQVGNGKSIHIWQDRGLPTPSQYKVISPPSLLHPVVRVEELIDPVTREWKMELIHRIFLPQEVDIIGGIALSSNLPEDMQIWAATANGRFNVRSAYMLAMEPAPGNGATLTSDNSNMRKFWKYLWSINIPHKVKHFAWGACKEILPTKENLKRRKVIENSECDNCLTHEESTGHLFWSCSRSQEIWAISKLFPKTYDWHVLSFLDLLWFIVVVEQWDQYRVEKVVMVAWAIWQNRNEQRVGGKVKNGSIVVHGAMDYLQEYQACCMKVEEHRPSLVENWTPPPPQHYKINVDGAVFGAQKAAGIGILVRDAEGRVIGACSKKIKAPLGAVEVEAKALETGVQFAKDLLIHDILLESDSLNLINDLLELKPPHLHPTPAARICCCYFEWCPFFPS